MSNHEPELITILEGPTPEFHSHMQLWNRGIYEGPRESEIGQCELRTNNGEDIRERCVEAWREGRRVQLDFPDELRMRQQLDVVSLRLVEMDEGTVLKLWVNMPLDEGEVEILDGDSADYDDDEDDDGLAL